MISFEEWRNAHFDDLVTDFLQDNKSFDNICYEIYQDEVKNEN